MRVRTFFRNSCRPDREAMKGKQARIRAVRRSKVFSAFVLAMLLVPVALKLLYPAYLQKQAQEEELSSVGNQTRRIEAENAALRTEITLLQDDDYLQDYAKTYGFAKEGEEAYILVPEAPDEEVEEESPPKPTRRLSWWRRIYQSVGKLF